MDEVRKIFWKRIAMLAVAVGHVLVAMVLAASPEQDAKALEQGAKVLYSQQQSQ